MKTTIRLSLITVLTLICGLSTIAQEKIPTIEVTTDNDRAQFAVQGQAQTVHVEVFSPAGELVFESDSAVGQSAEWRMVNDRGERVADGVYLATITMTDFSGKRRKRIEQITVSSGVQTAAGTQTADAPAPYPPGPISGVGTTSKLAKFTSANAIGNSVMTEKLNKIGVNITPNAATLQINGLQPVAVATNGTNAPLLLQTIGGKGGNTTGTTGQLAGAGASISLLAGNGGNAPTGDGGRGGNITLQPGAGGAGGDAVAPSGNVLIAPTAVGKVGIGTTSPTSKLTVAGGDIEIVTFNTGVKFWDGSVQTIAGLEAVDHNETLTGAGTANFPLSVNVPLALSGSNANPILAVTNTGSGAAISATGAINTTTQYNIGGERVLFGNFANTFAGAGAGTNTTGNNNSFFGTSAGSTNQDGHNNSFFGTAAGLGSNGSDNSFFGTIAGFESTGSGNAFFGSLAGNSLTSGNNNTFIGTNAGGSVTAITNATAIGANANVTQNNSLVLGSTTVNVGIGTPAPQSKLHVANGYIQLPFVSAAPPAGDCTAATAGRMVVFASGTSGTQLYICGDTSAAAGNQFGWVIK